jgi:uncharacterized protein
MESLIGLTRRQFIISGAAVSVSATAGARLLAQATRQRGPIADAVAPAVMPFTMQQVRLRPGMFMDMMKANRAYLMSLPNDRLAYSFQQTAGLSTTGQPYGGWEQPGPRDGHPLRAAELRGHFTGGHYLSACAQQYAGAGDEEIKAKADGLVKMLGECQVKNGNGYLSAFPVEEFDRLRDGVTVWAPFYTLHKIMAGLLDMYMLTGNQQALEMDVKLAGWVGQWAGPLSDASMQRVLGEEYGGMGEVLFNLAAATGNRSYIGLGHRFDKRIFFDPLAGQRDELKGLHANTHIPQVIGAARSYELTGDARSHAIAHYFWNEVVDNRTYATGGTSNGEHWEEDPGKLIVSPSSEECCCGYNMLKLTRHVFGWEGEARAMDYYERTLFNSRLGTQNKDGMLMYFLSLSPGGWKTFSTPDDSFWCCVGTGVEEYSKLANTIYYHDADGVYVNLYMASDLDWAERGVKLRQDTTFPTQQGTTITVAVAKPTRMDINLRIPEWVGEGGSVKINGETLPAFASPSSYLKLTRTWNDGDKIELALPMHLHSSELVMPVRNAGDEALQAPMYGPLVLATRMGREGLTSDMVEGKLSPRIRPGAAPEVIATSGDVASGIEAGAAPLEFKTKKPMTGAIETASLAPLYQVMDERYAVYLKTVSDKQR